MRIEVGLLLAVVACAATVLASKDLFGTPEGEYCQSLSTLYLSSVAVDLLYVPTLVASAVHCYTVNSVLHLHHSSVAMHVYLLFCMLLQ